MARVVSDEAVMLRTRLVESPKMLEALNLIVERRVVYKLQVACNLHIPLEDAAALLDGLTELGAVEAREAPEESLAKHVYIPTKLAAQALFSKG